MDSNALQLEDRNLSNQHKNGSSYNPSAISEINKRMTQNFRNQFPNPQNIPFDERLTVIANPKEQELSKEKAKNLDISDGIFKEVKLYQVALENAKKAISQLRKDNYSKLFRPDDFYAEMFKNDKHMGQIKARFESEKKRIEKLEKKKEKAIQKKFSKQNKHKQNLEASKEKRKNLDAIEKWKKNMRSGGTAKLNDFYKENKNVRSELSTHTIPKQRNKIKKGGSKGKSGGKSTKRGKAKSGGKRR